MATWIKHRSVLPLSMTGHTALEGAVHRRSRDIDACRAEQNARDGNAELP